MTSRWGWPARINYVQTIFISLLTCTVFEPHDHLVNSSPQCDNASEKAMHYIGRREEEEKLREEAADKSSLTNCNLTEMTIGKSHLIWNNVGNNTTDVKRGITKTRMLTGVYVLQTTKSRFNQYEVEQICPLCRLAAVCRGPSTYATEMLGSLRG